MTRLFSSGSWPWLLIAAGCALLDQLSKAAIASALPLDNVIAMTSFFNIVYILNPGAAFSFLASASGWQRWFFILIALVASAILINLIRRKPPALEAVAYALILAGALGNLVDRIFRGAVTDWLDFHWGAAHWPAFNLADVWITVGAALIVFASVRPAARKAAPQRAKACEE